MTRRRGVTAATVLAALVAGGALSPPTASALRQRVLGHVEADVKTAGKRLTRSFLGFSGELKLTRTYVAIQGKKRPNPIFVSLANRLAAFGSGPPTLRIGGGSTDASYWANGQPHPPGTVYGIDFGWLADVKSYITATGSPLIFGINLAVNRPDLAVQMANYVMNVMPPGSVRALEIGNEPDNYFQRVLYAGKMTREPSYGPAEYLRELTSYTDALSQVTPRPPIAGPASLAGYPNWVKAFPGIIRSQGDKLDLVTIHDYPLFACGDGGKTKKHVSTAQLLSRASLEGHVSTFQNRLKAARAAGKPLRMTETNSVACGGQHYVSDAFASALWGTDWLFLFAALGADGLDFHMSSRLYAPFMPFNAGFGRRGARVHPLYYAMLVFAEATAHRARILSSTFGSGNESKGKMHGWAAYDQVDHVVRIVLNNKSKKAGYVVVHVPGATGNAKLKRLEAPRVTSLEATWGGQTFKAPTFDGQLLGTPRLQVAHRRAGSRFRIRMPKIGVALLTVRVRSP